MTHPAAPLTEEQDWHEDIRIAINAFFKGTGRKDLRAKFDDMVAQVAAEKQRADEAIAALAFAHSGMVLVDRLTEEVAARKAAECARDEALAAQQVLVEAAINFMAFAKGEYNCPSTADAEDHNVYGLQEALANLPAAAQAHLKEVEELRAQLAFADQTNAALQKCVEGEAKLKAELAELRKNQRTP